MTKQQTIGSVHTYSGSYHKCIIGTKVRIVAVLQEDRHITDESDLLLHGGIKRTDRVEIQPWIESQQRYSCVGYDALYSELR
jgi:hypothetical protein